VSRWMAKTPSLGRHGQDRSIGSRAGLVGPSQGEGETTPSSAMIHPDPRSPALIYP
jgi:hypothetical protein